MEVILLHEQYHIRRRDYLVKLFAFVLLAVYWFHPLVWAAYYCMERDMEMSCDEWVIRHLGENAKADYSMALLCFAEGRRFSVPRPLSFGESQTKGRIKKHSQIPETGSMEHSRPCMPVRCSADNLRDQWNREEELYTVSESAAVCNRKVCPGSLPHFLTVCRKKIRSFAL